MFRMTARLRQVFVGTWCAGEYESFRKEVVMGNILTGDQAKAVFRKLGELHRQLGQGEYPHDPERLLGALQALTEGRFEAVATSYPSQVYCPELISKGWAVLEDVEPVSDLDITKLKPRSFLKDSDKKGYNEITHI